IPNQNLFRVANEKTTFTDAFAVADQVLHSGVACITDLMVKEGLINLDFADVRAVMREMGSAMMGTGEASGDRRALLSAEAAAANPDASRCFVGRDSDRPAPHGSPDRAGWPDSAARPRAGRRAAPSVHNLVRSKSGRDHSGCRQKPELGSARTETAGQSSSPPATAHVDAIGND